MFRRIAAALVTGAAGFLIGATAAADSAPLTPPPMPWWTQQACAAEDSVNCYWNATEHGTGTGHSFVVRQFPNRACWMYTEKAYALTHDGCTTTP